MYNIAVNKPVKTNCVLLCEHVHHASRSPSFTEQLSDKPLPDLTKVISCHQSDYISSLPWTSNRVSETITSLTPVKSTIQ